MNTIVRLVSGFGSGWHRMGRNEDKVKSTRRRSGGVDLRGKTARFMNIRSVWERILISIKISPSHEVLIYGDGVMTTPEHGFTFVFTVRMTSGRSKDAGAGAQMDRNSLKEDVKMLNIGRDRDDRGGRALTTSTVQEKFW